MAPFSWSVSALPLLSPAHRPGLHQLLNKGIYVPEIQLPTSTTALRLGNRQRLCLQQPMPLLTTSYSEKNM